MLSPARRGVLVTAALGGLLWTVLTEVALATHPDASFDWIAGLVGFFISGRMDRTLFGVVILKCWAWKPAMYDGAQVKKDDTERCNLPLRGTSQ